MKHVPRYRLRTLFILFFCASVGLATDRNPIHALQPAVATAMIIGLLQQIRELNRRRRSAIDDTADCKFALDFAVTWAVLIATAMTLMVIVNLLSANGMMSVAKRKEFLLYEPLTAFLDLCLIVVLSSSIRRWQSVPAGVPIPRSRLLIFGIPAILLATIVIVDGNLIEYLVHKATAGIEASVTPRFRRPGVYPDHASEAYRSFWLAFAAATTVTVGAACLLAISKLRTSRAKSRLFAVVFILCLLVQLLYCGWFYSVEYRRVSPDFAGVGMAAKLDDWLAAAVLVLMIVTAGAYRLSLSPNEKATISENLADDLDHRAFHETVPCLLVMGIAAGTTFMTAVVELASSILYSMFPSTPSWLYPGMFCNPTVLLILAQMALVVQLCWIRWQRRGQETPWEMPALPARVFAANWVALALATSVGVPTLNAFGFLFWLGPFNFTGI